MFYDAYRAPSNSLPSEDDGIYGDAGGTTPTDANGDANGENEGEEAHQSDAVVEEEEEDSEDVSHTFQRVASLDSRFLRMSSSLWSTPQCHWICDSRGRGLHVPPIHPNPQNHSHVGRKRSAIELPVS